MAATTPARSADRARPVDIALGIGIEFAPVVGSGQCLRTLLSTWRTDEALGISHGHSW